METFHCFTPEARQTKIVPLVSRLVTFEVAEQPGDDQQTFPIHIIGSQIIQALLHFGKPIKIVQSLLEMDTSQLRDLFCDSFGSRIMDAFVSAEFVGEKSRDKMIQKLEGSYYSLATTKFGSRALDALWRASAVKTRVSIGEELLQKETALQGNYFGRIIAENYALPLLKRQKSDWKTIQEKESKKRKLFADIVEPLAGKSLKFCLYLELSLKIGIFFLRQMATLQKGRRRKRQNHRLSFDSFSATKWFPIQGQCDVKLSVTFQTSS